MFVWVFAYISRQWSLIKPQPLLMVQEGNTPEYLTSNEAYHGFNIKPLKHSTNISKIHVPTPSMIINGAKKCQVFIPHMVKLHIKLNYIYT